MLAMLVCKKHIPDDRTDETWANIAKVTYGRSWNATALRVEDTGHTFPSETETLYYDVRFGGKLSPTDHVGVMAVKVWKRGGVAFCSTASFVGYLTNRIVGELHRDDDSVWQSDSYDLRMAWYRSAWQDSVVQIMYDDSAAHAFTIQGQDWPDSGGHKGD
jgi:hypothetical protein